MALLNETHDAGLRSWLASANAAGSDFPIQNLPFAVFRRQGSHEAFRGGVAIGDQIVDLIIGAGHMMAAAEIDPFQRAEEGAQHRLHGFPCALERRKILFAQAVHMDAVDALHMLGEQLGDGEAEAAARRGRIVFRDLAFAVHRIDA